MPARHKRFSCFSEFAGCVGVFPQAAWRRTLCEASVSNLLGMDAGCSSIRLHGYLCSPDLYKAIAVLGRGCGRDVLPE